MNMRLTATALLLIALLTVQAQGSWTALRDTAPALNNGVMLLLTDGSIITTVVNDPNAFWDDSCGPGWNKLIPDSTGSYVNGTWTTIAPMHNSRIYFSSWVLPSGKVYVAGGEFGTGQALAELYDAEADSWTSIPGLAPDVSLADPNSVMLPDGTILQNSVYGSTGIGLRNYFYSPVTDAYTAAPPCPYNDDEACWLMLPDRSILYVGILSNQSYRYIPSLNRWLSDATVPVNLYDVYGEETGAGFVLPDGRAFFLGSPGTSAYYTPSNDTTPGQWTAGPQIPNGNGTPDAPAAMLPNGRILCTVSPVPDAYNLDSVFHTTTYFYLFDYTSNSFIQIPAPGGGMSINQPSGAGIMVNLPDGTILYGVEGNSQYYIYTPEVTIAHPVLTAGKPTIDTVIENNCSFMITGTLFNGISQGSAYGDDWQMATNYPIVRLSANGRTWFGRTTNWNRTGIQTGSLPDTAYFTVPANMPYGNYTLVLSANGNSSDTFAFNYSKCVTDIAEIKTSSQLQVWPNPSTGVFNFQLPATDGGTSALEVFDMMGQKIAKFTVTGNENTIDLSDKAAGVYLVCLQTGSYTCNRKIVVTK